jgi:hypothetical protein
MENEWNFIKFCPTSDELKRARKNVSIGAPTRGIARESFRNLPLLIKVNLQAGVMYSKFHHIKFISRAAQEKLLFARSHLHFYEVFPHSFSLFLLAVFRERSNGTHRIRKSCFVLSLPGTLSSERTN